MKKSILLFSLLILAFTSCTNKSDVLEQDVQQDYWTIDDVKQMNIAGEFNLSKDVYNKFLESLSFTDNKLSGFYYQDIDDLLSDKEMSQFWALFNIKMTASSATERKKKSNDPCIVLDAKKLPPNFELCITAYPGWVCWAC